MTATKIRKMPTTFSPRHACCSYRWAVYVNAKADHRKWARLLANTLPRGAQPSEKQRKVLDELRGHVDSSADAFFNHLDRPEEDHQ